VEICKDFAPGEPARQLLRDDLTPRQYLGLLVAGQHFPDAVRFLAQALPKREAVWWACRCLRAVVGPNPPGEMAAAVHAAEAWAAAPSEDNRRAGGVAALAAGLGNPAGLTAMAAFWSGGSLAPPNVPAVPPDADLTARTVSGAIRMAVAQSHPAKATDNYRRFLALGVEVADGADRWPEQGYEVRTGVSHDACGPCR
jgi:hypothetical protein